MSKEPEKTMTDQIESILSDITFGEDEQYTKEIHQLDDKHLQIKSQLYQIVVDYREGFQLEAFENRYQELFEKYDFIVGDWGYDQLRLRGFYQVNQRKVPRDQTIVFLDDYLKEYCNFGCQYFVLAKEEALEKYEQFLLKQKDRITFPKIETPSKPIVTTKSVTSSPMPNKPKRQQRSNRKKPIASIEGANSGPKNTTKESFQIKNTVKNRSQKPLPSKVATQEGVRKTETGNSQTKQSHTSKNGSFVIKQKNPKSK